jgi:signal transduction histidine kinase
VIESILSKMTPRKVHVASLVGVLCGMFLLTAFLAWTTHTTHLDAVEQAEAQMADFAAEAVVEWQSGINVGIESAMRASFQNFLLGSEEMRGVAPPAGVPRKLFYDPECYCIDTSAVRGSFWLSMTRDEMRLDGEVPGDPDFEKWLRAEVAKPNPGMSNYHRGNISTYGAGATRRLVAWVAQLNEPGPGGVPAAAIGIVTMPLALDSTFPAILRGLPGLLSSSVMDSRSNTELFAIAIDDRNGESLFQAGTVEGPFQARAEMSGWLPGATAHVAIKPDMMPHLVAGGMPRSRLPVVLGLLLMNGTLVVLGFGLLRREEEIARLRSDFVAGVSHELRTPLAQIRMFAETLMLGRVRSDAERTRSLEIIDQEARRLTMLVENVLLYSRADRRQVRVNPVPADLAADVREAVQGFTILHRSRAIEIRTELQENVIAPVDRGALKQMLLNLLDNAAKYGPPDQRITVALALFGTHARVWVDDEGPGIPKGERERVFEAFVRLDRDQESPIAGSGIGLSLVRELALLHHGRTWADDAPNGGTRVIIELPGAHLRHELQPDSWAAV